jgi:hypothetical protein
MSFGTIILILLMLSVLGVLFTGIGAMLVGGEFNRKYGNKLMVARVTLQAMAIGMLLLLVMCGK